MRLLLLTLMLFCGSVYATDAPRPNIVVILVDDMGYSDIGCYGSEIETPNLDQLASNGLRFTQFYNYGRCCPTRAALLTGLHPHQVGIGHMTEPPGGPLGFEGAYQGYLNENCVTLAQVLKSSGYRTLMTGKWHVGYHKKSTWPLQRGFDRFYGCIAGACNYFRPDGDRGITDGNEPVEVPDGFYTTDAFTDKAIEFISEANTKDKDQPFFLYLAHNAPHWPLNAKWDDYQKYKGKYVDGWEALMRTRLAKQKQIGLFPDDIQPAKHVGPKWESLSAGKRKDMDAIMAAYAGCIDAIDRNVGKLTSHLREIGELDNTVIFFLSDNGACQEGGILGQGNEAMIRNPPAGTAGVRQGLAWANASNTPFRLYKHFVHEGGAATPMIAHWPAGIPESQRGTFVREHAYLPDFMPTCMELAGANYPDDKPATVGKSIVPLLNGRSERIHSEPIYWEHEGNAAMRWGDWKLVREYQKPWELYRINEDRTELNDLAKTSDAQRNKMVAMWEMWAKENDVAYPKRFNMYQFLNQKKKKKKNAAAKKQD
ncbi:MAG: arylsulfatase [Planctomycetaceae bacterium]